MTTIRALCPDCGEIDLRPTQVELEIVRDAAGDVTGRSVYRFVCPSCDDLVTKPADGRIARLLATGGVPVVEADADRDVPGDAAGHPEQPPTGPAFTSRDLSALHELLGSDDWFERLRTAA